MSSEERQLAKRMIAGEKPAFDEFADRYIPVVYRYAMRRLHGNRELAREVSQATLCQGIAKIATFRGEAALSTWLCAVCNNEIAGHFRRQQKRDREIAIEAIQENRPSVLEDHKGLGPESSVLQQESAQLVHEVLDGLPQNYAQALEWKYLENLPVKEIARRIDVGPKAAESLLTRARVAFKRRYAQMLSGMRTPQGPHDLSQRLEFGA